MATADKLREPDGSEFRRMADGIPNIVVVFSGTRNVYVNPAATAITGYTQDELIAMDFWDIIHPEHRHLVKERGLARQKGESVPREYEFKIKGKQGQERWLSINASDPVEFEGSPAILIVATDVTDRKFAEEELRKSEEAQRGLAQEAEVLAEIGRTMSSSLDIGEIYELFADQVRLLIPFDRIAIVVRDDQQVGHLIEVYGSGIEMPAQHAGIPYPGEGTTTERLIETRSGLIIQSADLSELKRRLPAQPLAIQAGLRSFLAVPLVSRDEAFGALNFRSMQVNAYTDRDLALAERVGQQIAGAIANAKMYAGGIASQDELRKSEEAQRRLVQEAEVLAEIGRTISSSLNIDEVYERFAEHVRTLIPFDRITISKVDLEKSTMTYAYITGTRTSGREPGEAAPLTSSQAEEVILRRSNVLFQSEDREEFLKRYSKSPVSFDSGLRSFLSVPLVAHDEVIGVLQLRSKKVNAYAEHHVALAERVAAQIAGAIANALLHSERAEVEISLLDSEERYRALAEHSPEAIFLTVDGEIRYANKVGARLFGASTPDELIGRRGNDFVADEYRVVAKERSRRLNSPGMSNPPLEFKIRGPDGLTRDVEVASVAIPYRGEVAILAIGRDVTDRKAAERARTEQATSAARAEELQRSRARVVATAESLRSEIAHNLHGTVQNKLIAMLREVKELRDSAASSDVAMGLDSLFHSLEDLIEHEIRPISQQLYPSILRRGLVPALQSLGDRFKSSLGVEIELDPDLVRREQQDPNLIQEPERLAAFRIVEEALSNVAKHANASKVVVALERGRDSRLQISVRDDGQGFDPEGTSEGMGLGTIKDYAEVVGGECAIRSTPGSGTEITASLPNDQSELRRRKAMPWI